MGFLDPSASLKRKFGSLGVALKEIATEITVRRAPVLSVTGPQSGRVRKYVEQLTAALAVPGNLHVEIQRAIPEHVGLGSGTQMALAVGFAVNHLFDLGFSVREIAGLTERGARSGIGIGTFEKGGLIVDGGRSSATGTPPTIARINVPSRWRFILVFDEREQGLNGSGELQAFRKLPPFSESRAARICHLLLMKGLPALVEEDIDAFGDTITEIQQSVGDYFAPAQGGRFMNPEVEKAVAWLGERGAVAMGQSSWGPTGFCLVDSEDRARSLMREMTSLSACSSELRVEIASPENDGEDCRWHAFHEARPVGLGQPV